MTGKRDDWVSGRESKWKFPWTHLRTGNQCTGVNSEIVELVPEVTQTGLSGLLITGRLLTRGELLQMDNLSLNICYKISAIDLSDYPPRKLRWNNTGLTWHLESQFEGHFASESACPLRSVWWNRRWHIAAAAVAGHNSVARLQKWEPSVHDANNRMKTR